MAGRPRPARVRLDVRSTDAPHHTHVFSFRRIRSFAFYSLFFPTFFLSIPLPPSPLNLGNGVHWKGVWRHLGGGARGEQRGKHTTHMTGATVRVPVV